MRSLIWYFAVNGMFSDVTAHMIVGVFTYCYVTADLDLLWLAETGCNKFLQILMFAEISCSLLK